MINIRKEHSSFNSRASPSYSIFASCICFNTPTTIGRPTFNLKTSRQIIAIILHLVYWKHFPQMIFDLCHIFCSLNAAQDFPQKPFTVCNKRMSLTAGVTFNLLRRFQLLHANWCFLLFKEYRQFERDTRSQMQIYASTKLSYARSVETHFWFHKRMLWLALQFFFPGCSRKYWCKSGHYKLQMWGVGESPDPFQITSQQEVGMSWWVGQWSTVFLECFLVKLFEQGILKCLWQEK